MVEGALEVIYRKELARLAPSYNACRFVSDLVRTATWGCYPHDAELNAPHVAEEEPVSSAKDSWARSAGEWPPIRRRGRVRHSVLSTLILPCRGRHACCSAHPPEQAQELAAGRHRGDRCLPPAARAGPQQREDAE